MGTRRNCGSENLMGAENQQERLVQSEPESSETLRQTSILASMKIKSELHGDMQDVKLRKSHLGLYKNTKQINNISQSEIPCRVSNIAQDSGDTIPMTGSNRWNPNDACTGASRAIPRVRFETTRFPVTTQGLRSLDGLDS